MACQPDIDLLEPLFENFFEAHKELAVVVSVGDINEHPKMIVAKDLSLVFPMTSDDWVSEETAPNCSRS